MPKPTIDQKKCIGCGTCVKVCPVNVFDFDSKKNKAVVSRPKDCIGCKACEMQCPVKAIVVK